MKMSYFFRRSISSRFLIGGLVTLMAVLNGCQDKAPTKLTYEMGERIVNGPFTYVIVESNWKTQLGEGFQIRTPQQRFLMLMISVTNGGSQNLSLPLLKLVDSGGKEYQELEDGKGVANWIGLLRSVSPAQTLQGRVVFDVPLSSFTLKLPNGGDVGEEKFVSAEIPLRIDAESAVQAPMPGEISK